MINPRINNLPIGKSFFAFKSFTTDWPNSQSAGTNKNTKEDAAIKLADCNTNSLDSVVNAFNLSDLSHRVRKDVLIFVKVRPKRFVGLPHIEDSFVSLCSQGVYGFKK